jgi:hypothetical protein
MIISHKWNKKKECWEFYVDGERVGRGRYDIIDPGDTGYDYEMCLEMKDISCTKFCFFLTGPLTVHVVHYDTPTVGKDIHRQTITTYERGLCGVYADSMIEKIIEYCRAICSKDGSSYEFENPELKGE